MSLSPLYRMNLPILLAVIGLTFLLIALRHRWCKKTFKWLQPIGEVEMEDSEPKKLWFHRVSRQFVVSDQNNNSLRHLNTANIHNGDEVKIEDSSGEIKLNK